MSGSSVPQVTLEREPEPACRLQVMRQRLGHPSKDRRLQSVQPKHGVLPQQPQRHLRRVRDGGDLWRTRRDAQSVDGCLRAQQRRLRCRHGHRTATRPDPVRAVETRCGCRHGRDRRLATRAMCACLSTPSTLPACMHSPARHRCGHTAGKLSSTAHCSRSRGASDVHACAVRQGTDARMNRRGGVAEPGGASVTAPPRPGAGTLQGAGRCRCSIGPGGQRGRAAFHAHRQEYRSRAMLPRCAPRARGSASHACTLDSDETLVTPPRPLPPLCLSCMCSPSDGPSVCRRAAHEAMHACSAGGQRSRWAG